METQTCPGCETVYFIKSSWNTNTMMDGPCDACRLASSLDLLDECRGVLKEVVRTCGGCDDGVPLNCIDPDCNCWETHECFKARALLAKLRG